MHVLLVPFGSHGDVHPLIGLGHALRARGHRVTFLVAPYFDDLIRSLGFEIVRLGEPGRFEDVMRDPDLWHPQRGFQAVARVVAEHAELIYPEIAARYVPGETVAVGGTMALGVRVAQEKLGIPAATVHLQPASIHTNYETPIYQGKEFPRWLPIWAKRAIFAIAYARLIDPHIEPGLNALRGRLGLPPARHVMRRWMHSPERVLCFFPEWYCRRQPDWPANLEMVGFPLYDERDATPIPADLAAFLDAGPPPIAFTPGSANLHARSFFEEAAAACRRLGRRGLLLTRFADQIPADLPEGVRHIAYAPFGLLLPRTAALVHHGGVGTSAQGMAAGVPQLVMPLSHDQFDNAARMERLGVARSLLPDNFRAPRVAGTLESLLGSPEVAAHCRSVAARFDPADRPMDRAAAAVEGLGKTRPILVAAAGDQ